MTSIDDVVRDLTAARERTLQLTDLAEPEVLQPARARGAVGLALALLVFTDADICPHMHSNHLATSLIHENQKPLARKVPHYRKSQLHATGSMRSKFQASRKDSHDIRNAAGLPSL